jgi:catalase
VLFDAVALPDGDAGVARMKADSAVMEFVAHQYRHGKTILALGAAVGLLAKAGIAARSREGPVDPGILLSDIADLDTATPRFIEAVAKHRHSARETATKPG